MKVTQEDSFEQVANAIRRGNELFTKELYQRHKTKFVSWFMKQYKLNQKEGLEVYHQSFLVFYYQIRQERLTELMSTIDTYLFGIGKKLMLKENAKKRQYQDLSEVDFVIVNDEKQEEHELTHKKLLIRQILKKVTEPCKSILTLYYYQDFSLESIANRLGYKNSGTVKKKKSLCLKHIREQLISK